GFMTGKRVARPPADNEADWCYAISPDGKTLAVGRGGPLYKDVGVFSPMVVPVERGEMPDKDRPILLRPLKTGVAVSELPTPKELARQPGNCKLLLFTPDGQGFAASKQTKDEDLVPGGDRAPGRETARFNPPRRAGSRGEPGPHPAVAVSNTTLAIGLDDGDTSLWDLATGKER